MSRWFYLNGEFVTEEKAVIPVTQTGFQRAYGIFDLFRTVNAVPRFLEDYLDRFERSQQFLNLSRIVEKDEIKSAVAELQRRNQFKHSTFKMVLLGNGADQTDTLFDPHLSIVNTEIFPDQKPKELGVITHEYVREYPEIKSLNYLTSYALHRKRIAVNASEVVYHQLGEISEASRCNIFAIKDGTLITSDKHILRGITRKHVLKIAGEIMDVEEGVLSLETFNNADELFATSTLKDITPIVAINGQEKKARSGYIKRLQEAFANHEAELTTVH